MLIASTGSFAAYFAFSYFAFFLSRSFLAAIVKMQDASLKSFARYLNTGLVHLIKFSANSTRKLFCLIRF